MINEEKIKLMTEIAIYEANEGQRDIEIMHFDIAQYMSIETIRSIIINTVAYYLLVGFVVLLELDRILLAIPKGRIGKYMIVIFLVYIIFIVTMAYYARIRAKERYMEARPRIQRYRKLVNKLHYMYKVKEREKMEIKPKDLKEQIEEELDAEAIKF